MSEPLTLRFENEAVTLLPDHVLYPYWGEKAYCHPRVELYLRGPKSQVRCRPLLDLGANYIVFDLGTAKKLGVTGPFRRKTTAKVASGNIIEVHFPEDGEVPMLLTDFKAGYFAWTPLVGFIDSNKETALLGVTGFWQCFKIDPFDGEPPFITITPNAKFKGLCGKGLPPGDIWQRLQSQQK